MSKKSTAKAPEMTAPGASLKQARKKANLSAEQVASRMNLSVDIIENIDRDNFEKKISPAFYRGYLRTYAQIVCIDADELISSYNQLINQDSLAVSITPTFDTNLYTKKDRNFPYFKWLLSAAIIVLLIFAGNYIWTKKFSSNEATDTQIVLNNENDDESNTITLTGLELDDAETNNVVTNLQAPAVKNDEKTIANEISVAIPAEEKTSDQNHSLEKAVLQMKFHGDCWIKVTDAEGKVLALGIKRSGKNMEVEGLAPLNIILGNAAAVSIDYNQQTVDLSGFSAGNRVELELHSDSELLR